MTSPDLPEADPEAQRVSQPAIQRRAVTTLMTSQVFGGVALTAGIAVMALLAEQVSGSTALAGLGGSAQVLGAALIAIPVARVMAGHGRRIGLMLGYGLAALGAVGVVVAGTIGSFPLLLLSSAIFGGASTSNSQARYAAADLAAPAHRGRDLSLVVWATTVGSVVGPNLVGPGGWLARALCLPPLTGTFLISVVALGIGVAVLHLRLRPDPLLHARAIAEDPADHLTRGSVASGLRAIRASAGARFGLATMALGHVVMVAVMVVTPLHMSHGGAGLPEIGLVISLHIAGMYALSPLTGMAVDRFGSAAVALLGSVLLVVATLLTSMAPRGHSMIVIIGLILLGLGWSCTMVSGSTALVGGIPVRDRPSSQGAADLVMGLLAAAGGAGATYVIDVASFHLLSLLALALAVVIGLGAAMTMRRAKVVSLPR